MARKNYKVEVKVKFVPFPDEETRQEAYHTCARLFLKARERELKRSEQMPAPTIPY